MSGFAPTEVREGRLAYLDIIKAKEKLREHLQYYCFNRRFLAMPRWGVPTHAKIFLVDLILCTEANLK